MNSHAEVFFQILASSHEITMLNIRDGDSLTGPQSFTTSSPRSWLYPFPAFGGFRAETPVAQEAKLPAGAAFGVEHLEAREVGVQDRLGCIENLLVQSLDSASVEQLCGDV